MERRKEDRDKTGGGEEDDQERRNNVNYYYEATQESVFWKRLTGEMFSLFASPLLRSLLVPLAIMRIRYFKVLIDFVMDLTRYVSSPIIPLDGLTSRGDGNSIPLPPSELLEELFFSCILIHEHHSSRRLSDPGNLKKKGTTGNTTSLPDPKNLLSSPTNSNSISPPPLLYPLAPPLVSTPPPPLTLSPFIFPHYETNQHYYSSSMLGLSSSSLSNTSTTVSAAAASHSVPSLLFPPPSEDVVLDSSRFPCTLAMFCTQPMVKSDVGRKGLDLLLGESSSSSPSPSSSSLSSSSSSSSSSLSFPIFPTLLNHTISVPPFPCSVSPTPPLGFKLEGFRLYCEFMFAIRVAINVYLPEWTLGRGHVSTDEKESRQKETAAAQREGKETSSKEATTYSSDPSSSSDSQPFSDTTDPPPEEPPPAPHAVVEFCLRLLFSPPVACFFFHALTLLRQKRDASTVPSFTLPLNVYKILNQSIFDISQLDEVILSSENDKMDAAPLAKPVGEMPIFNQQSVGRSALASLNVSPPDLPQATIDVARPSDMDPSLTISPSPFCPTYPVDFVQPSTSPTIPHLTSSSTTATQENIPGFVASPAPSYSSSSSSSSSSFLSGYRRDMKRAFLTSWRQWRQAVLGYCVHLIEGLFPDVPCCSTDREVRGHSPEEERDLCANVEKRSGEEENIKFDLLSLGVSLACHFFSHYLLFHSPLSPLFRYNILPASLLSSSVEGLSGVVSSLYRGGGEEGGRNEVANIKGGLENPVPAGGGSQQAGEELLATINTEGIEAPFERQTEESSGMSSKSEFVITSPIQSDVTDSYEHVASSSEDVESSSSSSLINGYSPSLKPVVVINCKQHESCLSDTPRKVKKEHNGMGEEGGSGSRNYSRGAGRANSPPAIRKGLDVLSVFPSLALAGDINVFQDTSTYQTERSKDPVPNGPGNEQKAAPPKEAGNIANERWKMWRSGHRKSNANQESVVLNQSSVQTAEVHQQFTFMRERSKEKDERRGEEDIWKKLSSPKTVFEQGCRARNMTACFLICLRDVIRLYLPEVWFPERRWSQVPSKFPRVPCLAGGANTSSSIELKLLATVVRKLLEVTYLAEEKENRSTQWEEGYDMTESCSTGPMYGSDGKVENGEESTLLRIIRKLMSDMRIREIAGETDTFRYTIDDLQIQSFYISKCTVKLESVGKAYRPPVSSSAVFSSSSMSSSSPFVSPSSSVPPSFPASFSLGGGPTIFPARSHSSGGAGGSVQLAAGMVDGLSGGSVEWQVRKLSSMENCAAASCPLGIVPSFPQEDGNEKCYYRVSDEYTNHGSNDFGFPHTKRHITPKPKNNTQNPTNGRPNNDRKTPRQDSTYRLRFRGVVRRPPPRIESYSPLNVTNKSNKQSSKLVLQPNITKEISSSASSSSDDRNSSEEMDFRGMNYSSVSTVGRWEDKNYKGKAKNWKGLIMSSPSLMSAPNPCIFISLNSPQPPSESPAFSRSSIFRNSLCSGGETVSDVPCPSPVNPPEWSSFCLPAAAPIVTVPPATASGEPFQERRLYHKDDMLLNCETTESTKVDSAGPRTFKIPSSFVFTNQTSGLIRGDGTPLPEASPKLSTHCRLSTSRVAVTLTHMWSANFKALPGILLKGSSYVQATNVEVTAFVTFSLKGGLSVRSVAVKVAEIDVTLSCASTLSQFVLNSLLGIFKDTLRTAIERSLESSCRAVAQRTFDSWNHTFWRRIRSLIPERLLVDFIGFIDFAIPLGGILV